MAVVVSNRQRPEEAWINAIAFCHDRNYARDHLSFYPTYSPDDHSNVRLGSGLCWWSWSRVGSQ